MSSQPSNTKVYPTRTETPLGEAFGLTSAPVSEFPSRRSSPPIDYYRYQPAVLFTHPHTYPQSSSNYTEACAATLQSPAAESEKSRKLTTFKRGMQSLAPEVVISNTDASENMDTRTSAAQKPKE